MAKRPDRESTGPANRRGRRVRGIAEQAVQAEDRRGARGRRAGGAHARRAGARQHAGDLDGRRTRRSRRSSPRSTRSSPSRSTSIMHHADFQKLEGAWRGLHYLVNNTETDEMLKIRVMNISKKELQQDAATLQGHRLGPEPVLQEALRGRVRPVRRRALRLPGRRLLLRPQPAGRRAARRAREQSPRRRTAPSSRARRPTRDADGVVAGARQPARPHQDLHQHRVRRRGAACASRKTRATSASPCRASSRACPTARRRTRSRSSTSRRTPPAPTIASTPGPTPPTRWPPTSTARSSCYGWCTTHPRRRVGRHRRGPAGAHVPHRRRRRRHEVPHRDRHQRPPRGGARQERLHAARPPQEHRPRGVHRRAVAAEAGGVLRSGRDRERQPVGAAALSVRDAAASRTT